MLEMGSYQEVRALLIDRVCAVKTENIFLEEGAGRVLAQEVRAMADQPPFDRSPYDGYAFRAEDTAGAGEGHPVTLRIVDNIAAGEVPHARITAGTAARLMTGAPVPAGADAILPFEKTVFTQTEVRIDSAVEAGSNIVRAGEDVKKGTLLCRRGTRIDAGLAGTLAGQGILRPLVYKRPLVAVISTGTELLEEDELPAPGRIYNTNRYALQTACRQAGCATLYPGTARDDPETICALIREAVRMHCDAVILSGGVSVGDYDCTPEAMEMAGVDILARGLAVKPGMAGAYGICTEQTGPLPDGGREDADRARMRGGFRESAAQECGIPVMALSGNPAACMTAFYAIVLPVLKKRAGLNQTLPGQVRVRLSRDYSRQDRSARLLRGRIDPGAVVQQMEIPDRQGNQMLSSMAGSNAFAEIPAGAVCHAGDTVEAFLTS